MITMTLVVLVLLFLFAPHILGWIIRAAALAVGSVLGFTTKATKEGVKHTLKAGRSIHDGYKQPEEVRNKVAGFGKRLQEWAEEAEG